MCEQKAREVSGRDDLVIGIARDAEAVELALHGRGGARRVGKQDHEPALAPERSAGHPGGMKRLEPVVEHTPDVADPCAGARCQGSDGVEKGDTRLGRLHPRPLAGDMPQIKPRRRGPVATPGP